MSFIQRSLNSVLGQQRVHRCLLYSEVIEYCIGSRDSQGYVIGVLYSEVIYREKSLHIVTLVLSFMEHGNHIPTSLPLPLSLGNSLLCAVW